MTWQVIRSWNLIANETKTIRVKSHGARATKWELVESSNVSAIRYNPAKEWLDVKFNSGGIYRYFDVPIRVWLDMREASSKGSFVHYSLKDVFDYKRMK